jgi:transcriptional regulator with XRE-family HTH domain
MSPDTITTLGERIRHMRESAKLSLRGLSEQVGIDMSLLGKIERGERQPTIEQIKWIAKYFKIDVKDMMKEYLSDQIANRIINENADIDILKVAEGKIKYYRKSNGIS